MARCHTPKVLIRWLILGVVANNRKTGWKERYQMAPWMVRIDPETVSSLNKPSAADAFQIRLASQARFVNRLGRIAEP